MKKIILLTSSFLMAFGLIAQNCLQTVPAAPIVVKSNGSDVGNGGTFWICENITYEISGDLNNVYVEKGGVVTVSGDDNTVFMKASGSLDISGDDGFYTIDSTVNVIDNGTNSTIDLCGNTNALTFDYQNVSHIMDCIDTATTTGINVPIETKEITLFPNPVRNVLNVNVPSITGPSTYRIYAVSGKVVLDGVMATSSEQIDMSGIERGLYFIEIQNQRGKVSKRISVE